MSDLSPDSVTVALEGRQQRLRLIGERIGRVLEAQAARASQPAGTGPSARLGHYADDDSLTHAQTGSADLPSDLSADLG